MTPQCIFLLLCFCALVSTFGNFPAKPKNPADKWPFKIYLVQCKHTFDKEWGESRVSVRKDKRDNIRKVNGTFSLFKGAPTDMQVTMIAKMNQNNNWVTSFRQLPRPINEFLEVNNDIAAAICNNSGLNLRAPFDVGDYAFNYFRIEPNVFPRALPMGDYLVQVIFTHNGEKKCVFEILATLERDI